MALSKAKQARLVLKERRKKVDARSLNGHGYFMDANHDATARKYVETGDESLLNDLPDYSKRRP